MPAKPKAKKNKAHAEKATAPAPEYGPLLATASIDSASGGKLRASRMGRSYELEVPRGSITTSAQITITVSDFEGVSPHEFQLEGRIVSNRVEIQPIGLTFLEPATLRIPHFCADKAAGVMYVAALYRPTPDEDTGEVPVARFVKLRGGTFNVDAGVSSIKINQLGTFYVCSSLADGVDFAVTKYVLPSLPQNVPTFHAVAFDWIPGEIYLWTRTSLDRPPAMDGPVCVKRKSHLKVEFEPKRELENEVNVTKTFEETFHIHGKITKSLLTGQTVADKLSNPAFPEDDAYETLIIQTMMVPTEGTQQLLIAKSELQKSLEDVKVAEEQAMAIKRQLYDSERKAYMSNIDKAKEAVREAELQVFPWMERHNHIELDGLGQPANDKDQDSSTVPFRELQDYNDLPTWTGNNMILFFGSQFIPCRGFQEEHLRVEISIVAAEKVTQRMELLEVPEIPKPGCKPRKVWVGSPKDRLYTFSPLRTRASFAELVVHVNIGALHRRCLVNLTSDNQTLIDIRRIILSQCFGLDLSEARFVKSDGKIVDVEEENNIRAQSLRPCVSLYGTSRRPGVVKAHNVVLSYAKDHEEVVRQIHDNFKSRGFPVWMDKACQGSKGREGLDEAATMVAFLSDQYNQDPNAQEQCMIAIERGIVLIPIWVESFEPRGWLKTVLKDIVTSKEQILPGKSRLSGQQLDDIAIFLSQLLPGPGAPVMLLKRMPAPNSAAPPTSVPERSSALLESFKHSRNLHHSVHEGKKGVAKPSPAKKDAHHKKS